MDDHTLQTLDFPKVVDRVASICVFAPGQEKARRLAPAGSESELKRLRTRTGEAIRLRALMGGRRVVSATRDPRAVVEESALGGVIAADDLLLLAEFFRSANHARSEVKRFGAELPFLAAVADDIPPLIDLEGEIVRAVDSRGEIVDSASPELEACRKELRTVNARLTARLAELIGSPENRAALQEPLHTIRDGRYVLPIKADHRDSLRGVVHDISSSGATLFVEPMVIVDLNNSWRELQISEKREVERILRRLSRLVASHAAEIGRAIEGLAEIDFCVARAGLAEEQDAAMPEIVAMDEEEPARLILTGARHPLLQGDVVPLDIELGGSWPCLVITGPNTGGKTVALKTVGLLSAMALSGLAIPADPGSRIPAFDQIFADIGDEQSIEQSLSTFGGHMRNIVAMLADANASSLLLLDELGAGTDPVEGSALAQAILEYLSDRKITTIATTHHGALKAFAHAHTGVRNASVEFDPETLSPTYRLVLDVPGRSNALEIAARIGLDASLVERARSLQPEPDAVTDALLGDLQRLRAEAEQARNDAVKRASEAERLRGEQQAAVDRVESEIESRLEQATEAIKVHRREMETRLRRVARKLSGLEEPARNEVGRLKRQLEAVAKNAPPHSVRPRRTPAKPLPKAGRLRVGDEVFIPALDAIATVLETNDGQADVRLQIGTMTARVDRDELRAASKADRVLATSNDAPTVIREDGADPAWLSAELDVRGMRGEEISPLLDRYINDAFLAGMTSITVVHGRGQGVLRRAVRDELARNPIVESSGAEGGDAATNARLTRR